MEIKPKTQMVQKLDNDLDIVGWTLPLNKDPGPSHKKVIIKLRGLRIITQLIKHILLNEMTDHVHLTFHDNNTTSFTPKDIIDLVFYGLRTAFANEKPDVLFEGLCMLCGRSTSNKFHSLDRFIQSFRDYVNIHTFYYQLPFYLAAHQNYSKKRMSVLSKQSPLGNQTSHFLGISHP